MHVRYSLPLKAAALVLAVVAVPPAASAQAHAPVSVAASSPAAMPKSIGPAPVPRMPAGTGPVFIENRGQWDPAARYLLRSSGFDMWITDRGVVYDIRRAAPPDRPQRSDAAVAPTPNEVSTLMRRAGGPPMQRTAVFLDFLGTAPAPVAGGGERAPGCHNYYIGNDHSHWATNVPLYSGARIRNLYNGVDAVFYLAGERPRYDLVVAPGADPHQVRMRFAGGARPYVNNHGVLVLRTALGEIRQADLFAYQVRGGMRERVPCRFRVGAEGIVRFDIGRYDRARELVIDPVVVAYATYLGGSGFDECRDIAADYGGGAYITGETGSPDYPTRNAAQSVNRGDSNVFITRLTPGGGLLYSTYLGGRGWDLGAGITVDPNGNACVVGITHVPDSGGSPDFPILNAVQTSFGGGAADAFVVRLNGAGALSFATYLGGNGLDACNAAAIDKAGNVCMTGYTESTDFPVVNPSQPTPGGNGDAFVTKLSPDEQFSLSTYFGGSGLETGSGIAVDAGGNIFITGYTQSTDLPVLHALQERKQGDRDGFVTKLAPDGAVAWSTYLGGADDDIATRIASDRQGNVVVTGRGNSANYPLLNAVQDSLAGGYDIFVTKFTNAGQLSFSTFLGSYDTDVGSDVECDWDGNVIVAGYVSGDSFPTTRALQPLYAGGDRDVFVTKLTPAGAFDFSTYLGSSDDDFGMGIALDGLGDAYVCGRTTSARFPTKDAAQNTYAGNTDGFVMKLTTGPSASVRSDGFSAAADLNMIRVDAPVPNPAVSDVRIGFRLGRAAAVTMEVYAGDGRLVATPIASQRRGAGRHSENISVAGLAAGVYTLRLGAGNFSRSVPLVVVR